MLNLDNASLVLGNWGRTFRGAEEDVEGIGEEDDEGIGEEEDDEGIGEEEDVEGMALFSLSSGPPLSPPNHEENIFI